MRLPYLLVAAFTVGGLVQTARGQAALLVLRSDLDCRLIIDGKSKGVLKAGSELQVNLPPGEHQVEASALAGSVAWQTSVTLKTGTEVVSIPMGHAVAQAEARRRGYWVDPETHLMWPAADNGLGVSWSQAAYHCRTLAIAGYRDWRLPTIDELQRLFGGPVNPAGHHVTGPIQLTGWQWSSSHGQEPGQQWALDFGDGARASVVTGDSGLNRALCVRPEDH